MKTFNRNLLGTSIMLAAAGTANITMAGSTTMVSLTPHKIVGNGPSQNVSLSKAGTHAAFESDADNFVLQDGNNARDIFLRIGTALFSRVSVNSLGQEARNSKADWFDGNNFADSYNASVSSDGKFVVYDSLADNLDRLRLDTNNGNGSESDIYLRDVTKKKTYRLSGIMDGADGNITPGQLDVDNTPLTSTDAPWKVMTEGNDRSTNPFIAGTLKQAWVSFQSEATNLSTIPTTLNRSHIYVVDLKTKKIELVSATHDASGNVIAEANDNSSNAVISPDGRFVIYQSDANNLVTAPVTDNRTDIFAYDRKLFITYQLTGLMTGPSPTNGFSVTAEADGAAANPSITGGGKSKTKSYMIAFQSNATNQDLTPIPGGDNGNDTDVFVMEFAAVDPKDANSAFETKSLQRVSAPVDTSTGLPTGESEFELDGTNSTSTEPVIAGTNLAYKVAFLSDADNLLAINPLLPFWNQDTNGADDVYVYDSKTRVFTRANVDTTGQQLNRNALGPAISATGKVLGFHTDDEFIVPDIYGNDEGDNQVYLRK